MFPIPGKSLLAMEDGGGGDNTSIDSQVKVVINHELVNHDLACTAGVGHKQFL